MLTNIQITLTDKAEICTPHQFNQGERVKATHILTAQLIHDGRDVHKYLCPACAVKAQAAR